jgi:OmcA/MtrC family decaheme c-type cytochrome
MFKDIHTGYNKLIFADTAGTRFSDAFTFAIGTATIDAENVLTFTATVTESILLDGMSVQDVTPTAYVAPYGYDTKDFIQSAKNTNLEDPGTGWTVTVTSTATTKTWTVRLDLDTVGGAGWTSRIADGTIQRVELGIRARLANLDGLQCDDHGTAIDCPVALNMVTKTFDIVGKKFLPAVAIVDVNKCNTCHEALATTFHTADRGGSVVGCRLCHTTLRAGGHLEMQSRSIDSYVHAIHAMQPFDTGDLVVTDAVAMLGYEHHVASTYPNFTLMNCESCHFAGTYVVPDRSGSLPGLHSAAAVVAGWDRAVDHVPSYVTGPASRACGSCHRARAINADDAGDLDALNEHVRTFGTMIEGDETVLDAVIKKLMDAFK